MNRRQLTNAPLLQAARGETPDHTPVWFMRQAGRSLPEYRKLREGVGMLESCFNPDMLAEITLQPVRRHGVDAAILFSDIVVPLKAAGVNLDIVPGRGPVLEHPIRTLSDVQALPTLEHEITEVAEGIDTILSELAETQALIGFVGGPFTLASYLVEGGPSKNHIHTKALMHNEPKTWALLMEKITATVTAFLATQMHAGIDAMQLFDSWAGFLTEHDYRELVQPYSAQILETACDIPRIHFGVGTGELLPDMAAAGPDVVGVDWRVPLDRAAERIHRVSGRVTGLQGNLDPAMLFASESAIAREVARIKGEARAAIVAGDATGHIFNLGHGVLPETDPEVITRTVKLIQED